MVADFENKTDNNTDNNIVHMQHVCFSYYNEYEETKVLDDLCVSVKKGSFTVFVGPSGCGKSTILSIISGLSHPTGGIVSFSSDIDNFAKIGYMLQQDQLLEWRTIYSNVMLGLEIQHNKTKNNIEYVEELLNKYDLSDVASKKPSELSGGMRQRVALIRTLAVRPELLLLDEPFSALDYQTRLMVSKDVHNIIKSEKKSAILVTHDIYEAVSLADTIVILTNKPCRVKKILPVEFEKNNIARNEAKDSMLFQEYYNIVLEELQNDK